MWIDFIVAGILILFLFRGDKRGMIASLLGIIGWAVSLIAAFLVYPYTVNFLDDKTDIRNSLTEHVSHYVKTKLISQKNGSSGGSLPDSVLAALNGTSNSSLDVQAAGFLPFSNGRKTDRQHLHGYCRVCCGTADRPYYFQDHTDSFHEINRQRPRYFGITQQSRRYAVRTHRRCDHSLSPAPVP